MSGYFSKWVLGALLMLVPLLWEALTEREAQFAMDGFGFFAWYGFVVCFLMIVVAVIVGRVLKRGDDYYDEHDD